MKKIIHGLKIGGSVITDKTIPYKANTETIREIAKSLKQSKDLLLISHGSGSFGHTSAKLYGGKNGYTDKWGLAKVARDAQEINRIVMDIFIEEKLPAISFSPRSMVMSEKGKPKQLFFDPIEEALAQGFIPVIYGDGIFDTVQKTTIFSGETILNLVCQHLQKQNYQISKIIQLCNVDGVLDAKKQVIPEITKDNWQEIKPYLKTLQVADVTGGMGHKVEDALTMTHYGIETRIVNGNSQEVLQTFLQNGEMKGTAIR